jgi:Ca2+/Na+ antiporter
MLHIIRDILFIISALALYFMFLPKGKIQLWQVSTILSLFVVYVIVYIWHSSYDKNSKRKANELARSIKDEDTRRLLE